MCSIAGCVIFERTRSEADLAAIESKFRSLVVRGEDRGRDSYGITSFDKDGNVAHVKNVGAPSLSLKPEQHFVSEKTCLILNNDRAEPTTEYVPGKTPEDIQPFGSTIYVTHNGVIANDHELEEKYRLSRRTKIDSAVLPPLLEKTWNGTAADLQRILRDDILGSYAIAIVDTRSPSKVFLACNYKPIFLEYDPTLDTLFFTSLESYLGQSDLPVWDANAVKQMEPYSLLTVDTRKKEERLSLWKPDEDAERRALVICSAGLDSTVAAKAMQDKGYSVTLLHFKYGHRAQSREEESIRRIAEYLRTDLILVETDIFKRVIKHSRLTETLSKVETAREGEAGAEFAYEWVPARNLIFIAIATGIAEAYSFGTIALGNNLEESGSFSDNEMMFVIKLREVLPYATNLQKKVTLEMPVGNLMKHEIVKLGLDNHSPLHLTWSCYEGGEIHCGKCGPCYMRRKAFEINGVTDPVTYASREALSPLSH